VGDAADKAFEVNTNEDTENRGQVVEMHLIGYLIGLRTKEMGVRKIKDTYMKRHNKKSQVICAELIT
jgi:hypothetical protein